MALAESFGRGAMTNHYIGFKNSGVILIMGSDPAYNHSISFKWITKAMENGAKLVCVDLVLLNPQRSLISMPPLRSGTDIAFLGGMIKYILDNKLSFNDYVKNYTNATFLINPSIKLPGENRGVFSGLTDGKYEKGTWFFEQMLMV